MRGKGGRSEALLIKIYRTQIAQKKADFRRLNNTKIFYLRLSVNSAQSIFYSAYLYIYCFSEKGGRRSIVNYYFDELAYFVVFFVKNHYFILAGSTE